MKWWCFFGAEFTMPNAVNFEKKTPFIFVTSLNLLSLSAASCYSPLEARVRLKAPR